MAIGHPPGVEKKPGPNKVNECLQYRTGYFAHTLAVYPCTCRTDMPVLHILVINAIPDVESHQGFT